jgi:hypothetical protein
MDETICDTFEKTVGNANTKMHGNNIINMKDKRKQPCASQPSYDKQLSFILTPNQIHKCILYQSDMFMTAVESYINPDTVTKQIKAGNDDTYCLLVETQWCEDHEESLSGFDCCSNVILEIKISDVYLYAEYGEYRNNQVLIMGSDGWRRGEEAFTKMAAMIGVRVSRELVITP